MTADYSEWIAAKRAEAIARGGRRWTLTMLTKAKQEAYARRGGFFIAGRKPGEIVNPETGEVATGCVTIGSLAETLGITTPQLTDHMEQCGIVDRVLTRKEVPMQCNPFFRKPDYYRTPVAAPAAVRAGLVVQIVGRWGKGGTGIPRPLILVTSKGQDFVRQVFAQTTDLAEVPGHRIRRESITRLHREGRGASEIVRLTGIPRRTVFRHLGELRKAA
ncbi:winged helix-turn-helix domain-containing protein [Agrobacterium sp. SORGH_AS 787]|uniref:winged helix-turn-helix domain-containing protein n=1 Tax=Agrobacterium sp. SORGH_AS 787 TaxID=3041775 RepID=UPI00277F4513|nr:hypothetical protein [Rhizobium sp. SORGH_AS_0787]